MLNFTRCLYRISTCLLKQNSESSASYYKLSQCKSRYKTELVKPRMDGWLQCGKYDLYVWSISGLETCVVVRSDELLVAFDIGYAVRESVGCKHVFISHGHMDHIAGLPQHAAKRFLYSMSKAFYHVPAHLVDPLRRVAENYSVIAETVDVLADLNIQPSNINDDILLPNYHIIKPFPTAHRVRSQGYLLYKDHRKLKEKYIGRPSHELAKLDRQGVAIHNVTRVPELAYTGDTKFDIFLNPPNPDLLKVKVLITEATYIDDEPGKEMVKKARDRGHIHLFEIIENAHLFSDVEYIVLMHFSDKYSSEYIKSFTATQLPPALQNKVIVATLARERT